MMMYGHVYVAQISLGAQLNQTVKAIQEAEAYPGPSLIIAYSPCEEHGYDLALSHDQMRQLTATGFWPLYRFDPRRADEGKLPLALDSRPPSDALAETLLNEQYLPGTKKKARTVVRACQFIRWLINNYHQYTNEK